MNDNLNKIFNIDTVDDVDPNGKIVKIDPIDISTDQKIESDYDKTRENLHEILTQGQDALKHALEVAKVSEHPRAFEVVGGLMKHLSDINHQLLDLHSKMQKIEDKDKKESATTNITNNTMFVGNTAELSKMIEQMRKEK